MKTHLGVLVLVAIGAAALFVPLRPGVAAGDHGGCKGSLPASGQTTPYTADTQASLGATVPDDGTVQAGAALRYKDNGDGTIKDLNTGLMWEKKVAGSGCLHCVEDTYPWSQFGSTTIWDWLAAVNAEGGRGFAGHGDWRIPNVKELQSILDYGRVNPALDPIFGPTVITRYYWSSTTAANPDTGGNVAWVVFFHDGHVLSTPFGFQEGAKNGSWHVRAVRGGCTR
ncbi:MAG TPA: DUF1566 domain-containing protein [Anaerolineae bacterium]|nr:DUF1566 domain-containing protein [Anaerolineae bacterium]